LSKEDALLKARRGFDRGPTEAEMALPDDKRPWTEYDKDGNKQEVPDYKACPFKMFLICGPPCCIFELQWCHWLCGPDADQTCDLICRCQTKRAKVFCCCGPQCTDTGCCTCCHGCYMCCYSKPKISVQEACDCDCLSNTCGPRYAGFQVCCCHWSCVQCPPCMTDWCCCEEETIYMDGDLKPMSQGPGNVEMVREGQM